MAGIQKLTKRPDTVGGIHEQDGLMELPLPIGVQVLDAIDDLEISNRRPNHLHRSFLLLGQTQVPVLLS